MNNKYILIAVICGLLTAMLFISPLSLGSMGVALSSFTAFPLFISVLGFGTVAGIISGATAAFVVAIMFGPLGALSVLGATLGPALWIGHTVGLSRNDDGHEEWYPLSLLLLRLTAISAAVVVIIGFLSGYSIEWANEQTAALMKELSALQAQANPDAAPLSDELIAQRSARIAAMIPYLMPVSILILMVLNLRLAERFTRARGWMKRPKDDIPAGTALPMFAVSIFAAGAVGSLLSNDLGLVAKVIAGAFGGAFIMVGLATVHHLSRGLKARPYLLPVVYITLFMSIIIAPFVAALGVAETLFQLRTRFAAKSPKT